MLQLAIGKNVYVCGNSYEHMPHVCGAARLEDADELPGVRGACKLSDVGARKVPSGRASALYLMSHLSRP